MYKINEKVLISNVGVCQINDIAIKNYGDGDVEYYILSPLYKDKADKIMIPVKSDNKIKTIVGKDDALKVMNELSKYEDFWVKDPRERKDNFLNILNSGGIFDLKNLYLTIQNKKKELIALKKMINSTDKYVLEAVTRILVEVISTSLGKDCSVVYEQLTCNFS